MWRGLVLGGLSLAWLFSCSSSSKNTDTVCNPKITQACTKAGCMGVQACLADGSDWGPCECTGTGGSAGASSGGTGGTSAAGGSGGAEPDGSSGSAGQTNTDSGSSCTALECVDRVQCCELEQFSGSEVLESTLETKCNGVGVPSCTDICTIKDGTLAEVVTCLSDIQSEKPLVFSQIIDQCTSGILCANIVDCLGDCL